MNKLIKISIDGQSKAVVASVSIEYSGEVTKSNQEIIEETIECFKVADKFATLKTLEKMR
jgi:hypothetical protein